MASLKDLIVEGLSRFLSDAYGDNIYANKFITNDGTSSQFVKGDGTLDSNTYATTSSLPQLPLSVANGGTGATNSEAAEYNILSTSAGTELTTDISDTYRIPFFNVTPSVANGAIAGYRTALKFWDYTKSKISSVLGIGGSGGIPTAPTAASGTNTTQIATTAFVNSEIASKADKVSGATSGNFASLDSNGNITDSGHKHSDYLESNQGSANSGKAIVVGSDGSLSPGTPDLSKKAISIPSGQVDSTSTSTAFTATIDGITELGDGVCCYLKNGIVSSAENWTLNINNLGAKPVYNTISESSRIALGFESEYTMLFIYNSTRVSGGCWDMYYGSGGHLPVLSKVYENYTCAAANVDKGYIYFMQIIPTSDNYYDPWFIHYTLEITTDQAACQGYYDITLGSAGTTSQYCIFNKFYSTSYYPSYNHLMAWYNSAAKYANRETYPIRIGERIYSAYQAASRARTYKIKVLELHGCRLTFPESIETYDSFYSDANYGYNSTYNSTSNGVLDNYDANTVPYQYYEYYTNYKIHDASTPLYRYRFVGFDSLNKLIPFTVLDRTGTTQNKILPISVPIIVSKGISWYGYSTNITTKTGRTGTATLYRSHACSNTPFYYNFNGLPPQNCTVYIVGSYDYSTDQFTLDSSSLNSWYLCVPDSIEYESDLQKYFIEGNYYWLLGVVGSSTTVYGALYLDNPLYYFDGKSLVSTKDLLDHRNDIVSNWNNQIFTKRYIKAKNSVKASITKLRGLSLAWNQLAESYKVTNGTATTENGIVTIVPTNTSNRYILKTTSSVDTTTPITNHLYLQSIVVKSDAPVAFVNYGGHMVGHSPTFSFSSGDDFRLCYDYYRATGTTATQIQIYSPTAVTFYVKEGSFMLFDLTMMFGPGCEPTAEKFFELFPKETYAYCAGTLINSHNQAETIKSYDANGTLVDNVTIPSGLNLKSSGFDHDEVFGTTKITRVGSVNLGDLTWVLENSSKKIFRCGGFSTTYGADKAKGGTIYPGLLCGGGYSQRIIDNTVASLLNNEMFLGSSSGDLYIRDTRYSTVADFKTAVNNVYITFSLATPIETTITDIGTIEYDCALGGSEEALQAYQSATSNTPTCTPFRCDLTYKQVSISNDKADKVTSATSGNFAGLDSSGNLTDSGHKHGDYVTALGTSGNNLTYTKNGTANNITVPFATNSTTATKLGSSTVGGSTSRPIYLSSGVPTAITSIGMNYFGWPTSSYVSLDSLSNLYLTAGSNVCAHLKPSYVDVEYTNDDGETWVDYEATNAQKIKLFTTSGGFSVGKKATSSSTNVTTNDAVRITVHAGAGFYCHSLFMMFRFYCPATCTLKIEYTTYANTTTWVESGTYTFSGNPTYLITPFDKYIFGNSGVHDFRLTLQYAGSGYVTSSHSISLVRIFSNNIYEANSTLAKTGHLYSFDENQDGIFPGNILPSSNNAKDLGSSSKRWRNIYGMNADIAGAITIGNSVFTGSYNSLSDKPIVYTKSEVDSLLNGISNFTYEVVNSLPAASSSTTGKMYVYNGHRYVTTVSGSTYTWVDLGSYDVSLVDYVTHDELDDELENRPIHQKVTEIQMQAMLDNETWEEGVIYYTVEES